MDIEKFSLVKRNDTGAIGIFLYKFNDDGHRPWYKISFPNQKEFYARQEEFTFMAPPRQYERGDKVRVCIHEGLDVETFQWKSRMEIGIIQDWNIPSGLATVHVDGHNRRVLKAHIYPMNLPNKFMKHKLDT